MRSIWVSIVMAVVLAGCATQKMSGDQLARVAKDWSLSIRASQVIPVYPLTEDLEPGDVFLVQTPIEEQVKVYLDKGFLPMENLVTRLPMLGYESFYRGWPGLNDADFIPPRNWQFPKKDGGPADYSGAPLATFPSYSFSVSRSGGLSMALPVQGVPIGLSLLDAASATGTITMKDAYTYGLPARMTYDAIGNWARKNRYYLGQFEPQARGEDKKDLQYFYLRVVNRVYLVKTVDISLFSDHGFGGSGSAGVPKEVNLLDIGHAAAAENFGKVNTIISNANQPGAAAEPPAGTTARPSMLAGGSVKVAMATSRSISLVETFARPLVIGFRGSDYPILKNGELGPPSDAQAQLEGRPQTRGQPIKYTGCDANCQQIEDWLDKDKGNQLKLNAWLKDHGSGRVYAVLYDAAKADLRAKIVEEVIEKP
jgi:hypothetical protein